MCRSVETWRSGRSDHSGIEYQRMDNVVALPGMAVAADGEVRSCCSIKEADSAMKRIALDTSSRATVALVKMLAPGYWNISPNS